jgi:xanthine dehydrogenase accessory factor
MSFLDQAGRLHSDAEAFVIATVVAYKSPQSAKPGSKAIIKSDGSITGWVGGGCVQPIVLKEARNVLETGIPKLLSISPDSVHDEWKGVESFRMACEGGGSLEIYLEPVMPKPHLVIVGHSPVAETISDLARVLDFYVCLVDPEATQNTSSKVDLLLTDFSTVRKEISDKSFVVVATMGNQDEEGLQAVIGTTPRYLGLVASEKKAKSLFDYLRSKGTTDEQLAIIQSPAGIALGGETMAEIAFSVMAEIIRVRRGDSTISENVVAAPAIHEDHATAWDPICGMSVETSHAKYTSMFEGKSFYFCSLRCKEVFDNSQESSLTGPKDFAD